MRDLENRIGVKVHHHDISVAGKAVLRQVPEESVSTDICKSDNDFLLAIYEVGPEGIRLDLVAHDEEPMLVGGCGRAASGNPEGSSAIACLTKSDRPTIISRDRSPHWL